MKSFLKALPVFLITTAICLTACGQPVDVSSEDSSQSVSAEPTSSAEVSSQEQASSEDASSEDTSSTVDLSSISRLQNTYKLLTEEKKLTIGYIGGSITLGTSAASKVENGKVAGSLENYDGNYCNRITAWFEEQYPDAEIESINAGIADTTTQFALYRLERQLMNTDGHDMPDLVFIEFTSNDGGTYDNVVTNAESLIRRILEINPHCEIIIVSTTVSSSNTAKNAYMTVAQHYKLLFMDVGKALDEAKTERGANKETNGTYYYTVDNLHPSSAGYELYADTMIYMLEYHVSEGTGELVDRKALLPAVLAKYPLVEEPFMITADRFTLTGDAALIEAPLTAGIFLQDDSPSKRPVCDSYVSAGEGSTITVKFTGSSVFMLVGHTANDINIKYRVDDGQWSTYIVNKNERAGQRYEHNKMILVAQNLPDTEHTLTLEFVSENPVKIGAICVDKKQ